MFDIGGVVYRENSSDSYFCVGKYCIVRNRSGTAGADAGLGAIGGIGDSYWSKNKSRSMEGKLVQVTRILAVAFVVLAVVLNLNF